MSLSPGGEDVYYTIFNVNANGVATSRVKNCGDHCNEPSGGATC